MLVLHYHPLSSFCWKALIALYENETPFKPVMIDFGDPTSLAAFQRLWPMAKMPVLEDLARKKTVPEASIVVEYLDKHYPGKVPLIPSNVDLALETRLRDRFFDLHMHVHMQKVTGDRLRPEGQKDPPGVTQAREQIQKAYRVLNDFMATREWANGAEFSLADCAACPALHYANRVEPLQEEHVHAQDYLERLEKRPSFARVLVEAEPYFKYFPG